MHLILASHNVHKIREYRALLKEFDGLDVYSLNDFHDYRLPKETGKTFADNASLKALDAAKTLDKWVLADDSGLVVPALGGAPGIFSARYAGEGVTDADNRKKLIEALKKLPAEKRVGYYECCIAIASPEGLQKVATGLCEGNLLTEERGRNGFGYDSIFRKYDYNKTFGEIDEEIKNRISHRRKAFDKLESTLRHLLKIPL